MGVPRLYLVYLFKNIYPPEHTDKIVKVRSLIINKVCHVKEKPLFDKKKKESLFENFFYKNSRNSP
jgi:hypothetical protein